MNANNNTHALADDVEAQLHPALSNDTKDTIVLNDSNIINGQDKEQSQSLSQDDGEGRDDDSFEVSPSDPLASLDPPPSKIERFRDCLLNWLSGRVHSWLGIIVMILIVADGAFFFFLLVGAHGMCRPRRDCDPRNWWYNWSIQVLNVLFTYYATVSLPWRVANAAHLLGRKRRSNTGLDLYGLPSEEIWFHIRQRRRRWIVLLLVGNCLTQYANQATRIVYYSFDLQNTFPGNVWTNVFFLTSMLLAAIGGFWQLHEETLLRRADPERFPPGPFELAAQYLHSAIMRKKKGADAAEDERRMADREERKKTCLSALYKWLISNSSSLRMWAL